MLPLTAVGESLLQLYLARPDSGDYAAYLASLGNPPAGEEPVLLYHAAEGMQLQEGESITLIITADDVLINRISAFAWAPLEPMSFDFTLKPSEGMLRIGWNKKGFALFGEEGYTDYTLDITFQIPKKGSGSSGILLRATDVSYYDAQVDDSYFGYGVVVSEKGVTLKRSRYALRPDRRRRTTARIGPAIFR